MESELYLRIILLTPPPGIDFGLQKGKGNTYETIQKQTSKPGQNLTFECSVDVSDSRNDGLPNFLGPLTQGPPTARFLYIDIGKLAGQKETAWERRIKVPLTGITWALIQQATADGAFLLEATLPGTAKDGGPSCATLHPAQGWKVRTR